jgi:hypothetical protein
VTKAHLLQQLIDRSYTHAHARSAKQSAFALDEWIAQGPPSARIVASLGALQQRKLVNAQSVDNENRYQLDAGG